MIENRITDPKTVTARDIERILEGSSWPPTVQFSGRTYTPALLASLNRLCVKFGARFDVRFYRHYGKAFDAAVLTHLPDVRSLLVDCLDEIVNEHHLHQLRHLDQLSFGVHRFNKPDFLSGFDFTRMRDLRIAGTARNNFDLAPLREACVLGELFIQGHSKNIEVLAQLRKLVSLTLSGMPKALDLSFVGGIRQLRALTLLLGSRASIDEISHKRLEEFEIVWVRGLQSVGDLRRFPALRRLFIENQARLGTLTLTGTKLREVSVHNCRNLTSIKGLETLPRLDHFRTTRMPKLDLDALVHLAWPATTKIVAIYSGSEKWNARAHATLAARGYAVS